MDDGGSPAGVDPALPDLVIPTFSLGITPQHFASSPLNVNAQQMHRFAEELGNNLIAHFNMVQVRLNRLLD